MVVLCNIYNSYNYLVRWCICGISLYNKILVNEGKMIIEKTFNEDSDRLPNIDEIKSVVMVNNDSRFNKDLLYNSSSLREKYTALLFPLINHEFLLSVKDMTEDLGIKNIAELHAGTGWLTLWMKKYNIPISDSVDNMSWKYFSRYLKHVKKEDSIKYVKEHPEIELFILSWPYMDTTAYNIWNEMQQNQYLLYIGEGWGGCTACDEFFEATSRKSIEDKWNMCENFTSFYSLNDYPTLFKK